MAEIGGLAQQDRHGSIPANRGRDIMPADAAKTIEDRIRAIEDRLEIYNLIASHPPSSDTGAQSYIQSIFLDDAELDLGGGKSATGKGPISDIVKRPTHTEAIKAGLAHFAGLPHVTIDGDRAVVTSYLQILAPHPTDDEIEVPGHGVSRGYRIHRVGANRWELVRTPLGWKIKRRIYRTLDGSEPALDILRQALAPAAANA
jgi:SnoaL-like protein